MSMKLEHRKAVRAVFVQKLLGETARQNVQLKRGDLQFLGELTRRRFAFNKATEFIAGTVTQRTADLATRTRMQSQLNDAAITTINHWHEANPGQMMEPQALVDRLAVMVGPESQGPTSQPHVDDFTALKDQPGVALTETEQGTQDGDSGYQKLSPKPYKNQAWVRAESGTTREAPRSLMQTAT